jgi:hypothetical protein
VAAELAHHAEAGLGEGLDGVPMSPRRAPGLTFTMPFHMASKVIWHRRLAAIEPSPTTNMRLLSPCQPSLMTVTSMLTMSPFFSGLSFGMPWHTTWLTEVHSDWPGRAGSPVAVADRGRRDALADHDVGVREAVDLAW